MRNFFLPLLSLWSFSASAQHFVQTILIDSIQNPQGICVADLDDDEIPEIVVTSFIGDKIILLKRNNATYDQIPLTNLDAAIRVGIADFNNDLLPDIVCVSSTSDGITLLRNTDHLSFAIQNVNTLDFSKGRELAIYDFDKDGDADIAIGSPSNQYLGVFNNLVPATTLFEVSILNTVIPSIGEISVGDFDRNGFPDLVFPSRFNDEIILAFNHGGMNFDSSPVIGSDLIEPIGSAVGDLNHDGIPDVVVTEFNGRRITVYKNVNNGQSFIPYSIEEDLPEPNAIEIADLDQDGDDDIVAGYKTGIAIYLNTDPDNLQFESEFYFTNSTTGYIQIVDLDLDGDMDILSTDPAMNKIYLLTNELISAIGSPPASEIIVYPNPSSNFVTLSMPDLSIYECRLFDISYKEREVHIDGRNIDVSALSSGIYFLEILNKKIHYRIVRKIIKI